MRFLALLALISPLALASPIGTVNQVVVFGDSLSDNGNAAIVAAQLNIPFPPLSNGPLWIDQFAAKLSVPDPQPFLALTGGTNYAIATAQTGSNGLSGVSDQLALFAAAHLGGLPADALYTFWAGANDVFNGANPVLAADNIFNNILSLAAGGGKYFLWLNLPDLGLTPRAVAAGQTGPANLASTAFNTEWAINLGKLQAQGINVVGVNVEALFAQIIANPGAFGFSNVTSPGQGQADPNSFLFWDEEHPTTAGHALVANLAFADLAAVPEPASIAVVALGLLSLVLWKRREKKA
ncbi:MAG TPA: SGNH/GDSL hydrolase family protein [Bryobacteraceae bacterium]